MSIFFIILNLLLLSKLNFIYFSYNNLECSLFLNKYKYNTFQDNYYKLLQN
jgi:hypothetical protein